MSAQPSRAASGYGPRRRSGKRPVGSLTVHPDRDVGGAVADVPAEPDERRTPALVPPVRQRAEGHSEVLAHLCGRQQCDQVGRRAWPGFVTRSGSDHGAPSPRVDVSRSRPRQPLELRVRRPFPASGMSRGTSAGSSEGQRDVERDAERDVERDVRRDAERCSSVTRWQQPASNTRSALSWSSGGYRHRPRPLAGHHGGAAGPIGPAGRAYCPANVMSRRFPEGEPANV